MLGVLGFLLGRFLFTFGTHVHACTVLTCCRHDRIHRRLDCPEQSVHTLGSGNCPDLEIVQLGLDLGVVWYRLRQSLFGSLGGRGGALTREACLQRAICWSIIGHTERLSGGRLIGVVGLVRATLLGCSLRCSADELPEQRLGLGRA